jgi:hypothetical protein
MDDNLSDDEIKFYWKNKFNDQPVEVRKLNIASNLSSSINELELEKRRLKQSYYDHVSKVNEKIKFIKGELRNFDRPD